MSTESARRSLVAHLLAWLAVPASEAFLARGLSPLPEWWQWASEFALFGLLGVAQWRFAKERWLTTLVWPAAFVVLAGLAAVGPTDKLLWRVIYPAGLVYLATGIARDLLARVRPPLAIAVALSVVAALGSRVADLDTLSGLLAPQRGGLESPAGRIWHEFAGTPVSTATDGVGGPPVVILSIDTLRADSGRTMQSYKRLAARGANWTTAMSTSCWTLPAVASLQTGLMPGDHGADCVVGGACQGIFTSVPTLAEQLAERGYRTGAVTANAWVGEPMGFGRGFQWYNDLAGVPPFRLVLAGGFLSTSITDASVVVDEALAWLDAVPDGEPFYLWLHFIGPHMPYLHSPSESMRAITGDRARNSSFGPKGRALLRESYENEVTYTDREVMRLLDSLEKRGVLDKGVVVLVSDHGEEFYENGGVEHGQTHHGVVTEVPLVIVAPGMASGERREVASLLDVASTVRAAVGLAAGGFDLRSPLPVGRVATAFGTMYAGPTRSARDESERVIGSRRSVDVEHWDRYDLETDPTEQRPLGPREGSAALDAARAVEGPAVGQAATVNKKALEAIGYLQ